MTGQGLPVLEQQKIARDSAAAALDQVQPGATRDLDAALALVPALVSEASSGRAANAIRALQLESEVRANPELCVDRSVQGWRQLDAQRDKLAGWQHEDARVGIEKRMTASRLAVIERTLATVESERREVFLMRRFDSLGYPEVAERLGISVTQVERHIAGAMLHLSLRTRAEAGPRHENAY